MERRDDEPVPISALQHYVYCPRQCALIYVEQAWQDNEFTMRGHRAHATVDLPSGMLREGVRTERALPLWSERLGLVGRADVVEFEPDGTPCPVEHKMGRQRCPRADEVQVCAQGLCLEEMFGRAVPVGHLFSRASRRRREVPFKPDLRRETEHVIEAVHALLAGARVPPPLADQRCQGCSLEDVCRPFAARGGSAIRRILAAED